MKIVERFNDSNRRIVEIVERLTINDFGIKSLIVERFDRFNDSTAKIVNRSTIFVERLTINDSDDRFPFGLSHIRPGNAIRTHAGMRR